MVAFAQHVLSPTFLSINRHLQSIFQGSFQQVNTINPILKCWGICSIDKKDPSKAVNKYP
jgi:hypothetical protein